MPSQVDVDVRERVTPEPDGTFRAWVDLAIPGLGLSSRVLIGIFLTKREAQLQAARVAGNIRAARSGFHLPGQDVPSG